MRIRHIDEPLQIGKIICVGRNYALHAAEMKAETPSTPFFFLKPSTAVIYDNEPIVRPTISTRLHHEAEIIVGIGSNCKNASVEEAESSILGYGIGLDMTLRDIQDDAKKQGLPWSTAKGFDTSAPISEIIPAGEIKDPLSLEVTCTVNGTVRQRGSARDMIFSPPELLSFASRIFTLERGDILFTGTPEGVGEVKPGDSVSAGLTGYLSITHRVEKA